VDDLKRRINKMLKEDKSEKQRSKESHEEEVNLLTNLNNTTLQELKKALTTFEE